MATRKAYVPDVEISAPLKLDKSWSFRWNDEKISFDQYKQLVEDHAQWVKDLGKKVDDDIPTKRRKKK
jgi:hypothetical protein